MTTTKQLLTEASNFIVNIKMSKKLQEAFSVQSGKHTMILKGIPATVLNRKNNNGRIYSTDEMNKAIAAAKPIFEARNAYGQGNEHPEGSFVAPTHASHIVTNAYIKNVLLEIDGKRERHDVLFNDWEVFNTDEGRNLQALILAESSVPVSIRGLGDMQGDYVVNYEYLSTDCVSNPSSSVYMRMPVKESVKVEMGSTMEAPENALDEASKFVVSTFASNSTHDLNQAIDFQNKVVTNTTFGTITNMGTKMDQEVDPKTGVQKTIGEVEVETSDETTELQQALEIAGRAFSNQDGVNVTQITIEKIDDDEIKDSAGERGDDIMVETPEDPNPPTATTDVPYYIIAAEEDGEWAYIDPYLNAVSKRSQAEMYADKEEAFKWVEEAEVKYPHGAWGVIKVQRNPETGKLTVIDEAVLCEVDGVGSMDDILSVDDNKLTLDLGNEVEIEREFDTEKQAKAAKAGIETDEVDIDKVMFDESTEKWVLVLQAGDKAGWHVTGTDMYWDITADEDEAAIFNTEEEANQFRHEHDATHYIYPNDLISAIVPVSIDISEAIFQSECPPSDPFIQDVFTDGVMCEEIKDVKVTLGNIEYDVDLDSDYDADLDLGGIDAIEILEQLPDTLEIELKGVDIPETNAAAYIFQKAREETGLPIKNAIIVDIDEINVESAGPGGWSDAYPIDPNTSKSFMHGMEDQS